MRIGMIMDTPFPPDARVENEVRVLAARGHEVSLFHIDYQGRPVTEEFGGVRIIRRRGSRLLYKLSALACTVPLFRWMVQSSIREFIRTSNVEVLHVHDMVIAEAVFAANREFSLPVILDLHENRPEIMALYRHVNRWPGKFLISLDSWRRKQKELMQRADHVLLVTEEARQAAFEREEISPEKTTAVPNVVRLQDFAPPSNGDRRSHAGMGSGGQKATGDFTLLYVGDTSIRRGTLTALEALDLLRGEIPGLRLVMVGSSSQDHLLHRFVEERGLKDYVHFTGWQEPARLPGYILDSDVCLSPLLRNPHHDTTYANKLFQYMAMGRPAVVSDCPAQAEVVRAEECGLVHRAGDAGSLTEKILICYRDEELRSRMGRNGAKAVRERWNWDVTGPRLLSVYERLKSRG